MQHLWTLFLAASLLVQGFVVAAGSLAIGLFALGMYAFENEDPAPARLVVGVGSGLLVAVWLVASAAAVLAGWKGGWHPRSPRSLVALIAPQVVVLAGLVLMFPSSLDPATEGAWQGIAVAIMASFATALGTVAWWHGTSPSNRHADAPLPG